MFFFLNSFSGHVWVVLFYFLKCHICLSVLVANHTFMMAKMVVAAWDLPPILFGVPVQDKLLTAWNVKEASGGSRECVSLCACMWAGYRISNHRVRKFKGNATAFACEIMLHLFDIRLKTAEWWALAWRWEEKWSNNVWVCDFFRFPVYNQVLRMENQLR